MSINEPCFKKLYESCCDIIKNSNDKNIKNKQTKLDDSYNKLIKTQDCELQEFYSIVLELRVYEYLLKNKINIKATNDTKKVLILNATLVISNAYLLPKVKKELQVEILLISNYRGV